jgi:hypothetical protein
MLRRQRTILHLLGTADGAVTATRLQKYLFLLREQTSLRHDPSFYEFVPYKFGPFSFAAQREIEALTAYGYIESVGSSLKVTELGGQEANCVDGGAERAVFAIVSQHGRKPLRSLLGEVYREHPWYASNSELEDLIPIGVGKPNSACPAVYTVGYQNRSVDGFLDRLVREGIRRIVDVRANPVSRKYGFARSALASLANKLGIGYSHFPALGISSAKRKEASTRSDFAALFRYYERELLPARAAEIESVADLMKATPSVLVCMERKPEDCHRSRLATLIASKTSLTQVHL